MGNILNCVLLSSYYLFYRTSYERILSAGLQSSYGMIDTDIYYHVPTYTKQGDV